MEALAKLLQQAQTAVLSTQEDVASMRAQLDEFGDEAIVNPCVVDLQVTIQQKQEAAAELLKRGATLFYESMGDLEEKARALGNVKSRERELEKTKKAMQRYFETQKKTQEDLKSEYDGLLSIQEDKLAHMTDGAADLMQVSAARLLQHKTLTRWLKKAMIRSFWRLHQQQEERQELQQSSFTQEYDALAVESHGSRKQQVLRQKLFHAWERKTHQRLNARLRKEVGQLEKEAEFFRSECAKTQRVLSGHLQNEHAKMDAAAHAQVRECELLDDEVERLKTALTEITGEFSERTQTYVRQQEETELFFKRKETKLREALVETQTELERLRAHSVRLNSDVHVLEASVVQHVQGTQQFVFWEAMSRKEAVFVETATLLFSRLAQRHKSAMGEVAELRDNVHLLAPLSEKVLRLENALAASTDLATSHKKAARQAQQQVDRLATVAGLLTDKLEQAHHHKLRSFYFMCWSTHAVARRKRALAEANETLRETLRTKQKDFLVQQQGTASDHRERVAQLTSEMDDQRVAMRSLERELDALKDRYERKEGEHYEAQMDIHKLKAQLARAEEERKLGAQKLATARVENLKLDEDNARFSIEYKEIKWRWGLHQQHVAAWREDAGRLSESNEQLTQVCGQWSEHCEKTEGKHDDALKKQRQLAMGALSSACRMFLGQRVFAHWRAWSLGKRAREDAEARHVALVSNLERTHAETLQTLKQRKDSELLALRQDHERDTNAIHAAHTASTVKQANLHNNEINQLRAQHSETVMQLQQLHQNAQRILRDELHELQSKLDEVGGLVVFYCAQAAFSKWRTFAKERSAARTADTQFAHYQQAAQTWMTTRAELITYRYQLGDELLLGAVAAHQMDEAAHHLDEYRELMGKHRQLSSLFEQVTSAGEAMEQQVVALKAEVRKLRLELSSEKDYAVAMKARLSNLGIHQSAQRYLFERTLRHQQHLGHIAEAHLQELLLIFEDASQRVTDSFRQAQEERLQDAECRAQAAASAAPPEVSSIAAEREEDLSNASLENRHDDDEEAKPSDVPRQTQRRDSDEDGQAVPAASPVIPAEVQERLRALEEASRSFVESGGKDSSSLESMKLNLRATFLPPAQVPPPPSSPQGEAAVHPRRLPARRAASLPPSSVEAAIEIVRRSALCMVECEASRQQAAAEASQRRLESLEETLQDVRHSMETMLEEQRRMAADMKQELSHSRSVVVSPSSTNAATTPQPADGATPQSQLRGVADDAETQTSAYLTSAWSERLEGLTSRYQRVLDAFCSNLEERRETFYSVNGMLVATEMFSEELLSRFEANAREMQRIKAALGTASPAPASAAPTFPTGEPARTCHSQGTSPVNAEEEEAEEDVLHEQQRNDGLLSWQRRLAEVAEGYEAVLQRFLASLSAGSDAFERSASVLREADAFSKKLVDRFQKSLAAVEQAKEQSAAEASRRSLTGDFTAASREPLAQPEPQHPSHSPSVSPSSVAASSPSSGGADRSTERESPEKVILRDRVELLEKLLVQAKVQLAETRQILASSGGIPPSLSGDAHDSGHADAASVAADTIRRLREKEQETRKAHEAQLIRVRADTEQLVAMRYKDERQRCEERIRELHDKLEDNNRFYEAEKAKMERQLEALARELAEKEEAHRRAVEQVRRNFQREIDELAEENALMQEELQEREVRAAKAVELAKAQQRELLEVEHEARVKGLQAEVRQLTYEKTSLKERAAASDREWAALLMEERQALEEAGRRHEAEVARMEERYEELLKASRQAEDAAGKNHARAHVSLEEAVSLHEAADTLAASAVRAKCDFLLESGLALMESHYAALFQEAVARLECEKEELETDNVRLNEQVALLKSQPPTERAEDSAERGADVNDLTRSGKATLSPSMPLSYPTDGASPSTPGVCVRGLPPRGTPGSSASVPPHSTSSFMDHYEQGSPSPTAAGAAAVESTPARGAVDSSSVTPTRSSLRSRSLDSLELSQQMLRYSRMLHKQEERNSERLHNADALTAQVEDLIARGERLRAFAEREHFTPRKRR